MGEELRFAYLNADMLGIEHTVQAKFTSMVDVPVTVENIIMIITTTGVQYVVRDTLGIAVMPK